MMRLTLDVRSYCDQAPADSQSRSFDAFPVIIGRSSSCDYSLSDESRYISSNHAVVVLDNGQLLIQDTSANGVYVNGSSEPVGRGRSLALNGGDSLAIGDYTINVVIDQRAASTDIAAIDDPFADFGAGSSAAPSSPAAYDPFRGDEPDWTPPSQSSDPFGDDWDMNDQPTGAASTPDRASSGQEEWADWSDDITPPAPDRHNPSSAISSPAADDDFDWLPGTSSETVSIPPSLPSSGRPRAPLHPGSNSASSPRKPDYPAAQRPSQRSDQRDPRAQAHQHPTPPGARQRQSSQQPARPRNRTASRQLDQPVETLLRAATLREADFARYSEAQVLEQTGKVLALTVDAMMVLLQSRAEIKNAIKSDVTTLSRSDNNPLKFSFSAADALTKLLSDDVDGYMSADSAIQEAVDDLKLHQLAMLDGMKAAVRSMLLQFDPSKLAKNLEKSGGLSANIPITREAKLWELFCEQYDAIREEAVSDFGELFGAEFRKAYEKRIKQLGRNPDF